MEAVQRIKNDIHQTPVMESSYNKGRDDWVVAKAPKIPPVFVETEM